MEEKEKLRLHGIKTEADQKQMELEAQIKAG